ncbi:ankyrin-3-like [Saccostrea cucullata]|uniref:ankyrin-3-like n=1 Tax=Saccostrea cuccullata TaxID=36930 RepID=UPI002ED2332D
MSASSYPTTEETTNVNRRNRLLLGPCTDQLRDVLRQEVPPNTFSFIFKQKEKNISHLNAAQKALLYPVSGSYTGKYNDMDISLLYILLRNITNIPQHKKKWGNEPDISDRSLSANVERIRIERNSCVHSPDASTPNIKFNDFWSKIENVVAELDSYLGNGGKCRKETDYLRSVEMDPALDLKNRQEIKRQAEEEKDIKEKVEQLENTPENKKMERRIAITESSMKQWKKEDVSFVESHAFPDIRNKVDKQPIVLEYFKDNTSFKPLIMDTLTLSKKKEQFIEIIGTKMSPKLKEKSSYASGFTLMTAACLCRSLPLVKEILNDIEERRNLFYLDTCVNSRSTLSLNSIYGDNRTPLEAAILSRDTSFVKELIEIGADVNFRSPLFYAMKLNALEIENVLLENGAGISEVLEKGSLEGNENVVFKLINGRCKEILEERGIFQSSLDLALYKACQGEHCSIIETLIEHGARINASFKDGWTPLHIAIGRNNAILAECLINKGSDCKAKECLLERTPLHLASQKHLLPTVNLLLKKGTNCNERDVEKCTPLHLAIDPHDNIKIDVIEETEDLLLLIQTLIDNNANIDICDENQTSPLLSACKNQMWLVAERLITNGPM